MSKIKMPPLVNKAQWVRERPDKTPAELMKLAAKQGFAISATTIHQYRYTDRKREEKAKAAAATPARKASRAREAPPNARHPVTTTMPPLDSDDELDALLQKLVEPVIRARIEAKVIAAKKKVTERVLKEIVAQQRQAPTVPGAEINGVQASGSEADLEDVESSPEGSTTDNEDLQWNGTGGPH